jgi:dihydroorotate dehydrogenase
MGEISLQEAMQQFLQKSKLKSGIQAVQIEDAWEKITAGASLLQVYTGWIYQGPWMVKDVLQGLGNRLTDHNLTHISQAVGINANL